MDCGVGDLSWADAIFVGTVNEALGTETAPDREIPESQFQVNVLETLKGELPNTVVVNQAGGAAENGDVFEFEDSPKLESGKTYLLSTRIYVAKGWLTASSVGVGEIPDASAAQRSAEIPGPDSAEPIAVQAMRDAIANQKPFGDEATRPDLPAPESLPSDLSGEPAGPPVEGTTVPTDTAPVTGLPGPGGVTPELPQPGVITSTAVPMTTN